MATRRPLPNASRRTSFPVLRSRSFRRRRSAQLREQRRSLARTEVADGRSRIEHDAAFAGNASNTGTIGSVSVGLGAKPGVYTLVCIEPATNAGRFTVEDPDGILIGVATVAVAFSAGGLGFTIADGAPAVVSGEGFTITVAAGSGKYREYDPASTDGSQTAAAVLFAAVDAAAADKPGVAIVRDAEVNAAELSWFTGATADQKAAGLAQLAVAGIIGR